MNFKLIKYFLISLLIIVIDQIVKLSVHANMEMGAVGEIQLIGDVFKLHYTLNPGMAFGLEMGFPYGKLLLSMFRLVAAGLISYGIYYMYKEKANHVFIICVALILGGALGNLFDSAFYGYYLDNAPYDAISPWFHGQVIDMFYIDIWEGYLPDWLPIYGGGYASFWPIFNIADGSIFVAVIVILINQKKYFNTGFKKKAA